MSTFLFILLFRGSGLSFAQGPTSEPMPVDLVTQAFNPSGYQVRSVYHVTIVPVQGWSDPEALRLGMTILRDGHASKLSQIVFPDYRLKYRYPLALRIGQFRLTKKSKTDFGIRIQNFHGVQSEQRLQFQFFDHLSAIIKNVYSNGFVEVEPVDVDAESFPSEGLKKYFAETRFFPIEYFRVDTGRSLTAQQLHFLKVMAAPPVCKVVLTEATAEAAD